MKQEQPPFHPRKSYREAVLPHRHPTIMPSSTNTLRAAQLAFGLSAAAALWLLRPRGNAEGTGSRRRPVVLITGGATGLGLELARAYARSGARIVLSSRSSEQLNAAQRSLLSDGSLKEPHHALLLPADLSDKAQAASVINQAFGHFERLDVLINCAGIIEVGPIENQPIEAFEQAMAANFFTALYTTLAALPRLLTQQPLSGSVWGSGPGKRRASVVTISSIGGKFAVPHLLPYVASKFALTGFSEGLHAELRAKGIRVTTVCPGLMRTGSHVRAKFVGDAQKEEAWFDLGATTPGIAASVSFAAGKIFRAQQRGAAEITITPQAWLAARINGLAPGLTSIAGSLANQLILPAPTADTPTPIPSHT